MGKKGAVKQPKPPPPKPSSPVTSPSETPVPEPKNWLDGLDEIARDQEKKKAEERQRKADEAKRKEETKRWYKEQQDREQKKADVKANREGVKQSKELKQLVQRAKADGILEAVEHIDGLWYVEISKSTWKEVDNAYWCPHCEASLNECTLGAHIDGQKHQKKMQWVNYAEPAATSFPPATAAPAGGYANLNFCPPSAPAPRANGHLEVWQEADGYGGIRCLACNKCCDGMHESTAEHARRVEAFIDALTPKNYAAPEEEWLAWVGNPEWGEGKWLKCLMCEKWVQDHDGTNTVNYTGAHGRLGPNNQKDHRKKMENLDSYRRDTVYWGRLLAERQRWHPTARPQPSQRVLPTPQQSQIPAITAAPWAQTPAQPPPKPPRPSPPQLPSGWFANWDEDQSEYYYYDEQKNVQWEIPTAPARMPLADARADDDEEVVEC